MKTLHFIEYAKSEIEENRKLIKQYPRESASLQRVIDGWLKVIDNLNEINSIKLSSEVSTHD